MNRLENYYLAKDALSYMEGMGTGEKEIVKFVTEVMDEFSGPGPDYLNANEVIDLLDEIIGSVGIVEDPYLQQAFDLICEKAIEHHKSLCTPEEFEQWYHDVLTNYGGRGDL